MPKKNSRRVPKAPRANLPEYGNVEAATQRSILSPGKPRACVFRGRDRRTRCRDDRPQHRKSRRACRPEPASAEVQPRGLLIIPAEVEAIVAQVEPQLLEDQGPRLAPDVRWKLIIDQTLDWYFRDQWVSYRETPRGVDVLAVGLKEIGQSMQSGLSQDELLTSRTRQIQLDMPKYTCSRSDIPVRRRRTRTSVLQAKLILRFHLVLCHSQ